MVRRLSFGRDKNKSNKQPEPAPQAPRRRLRTEPAAEPARRAGRSQQYVGPRAVQLPRAPRGDARAGEGSPSWRTRRPSFECVSLSFCCFSLRNPRWFAPCRAIGCNRPPPCDCAFLPRRGARVPIPRHGRRLALALRTARPSRQHTLRGASNPPRVAVCIRAPPAPLQRLSCWPASPTFWPRWSATLLPRACFCTSRAPTRPSTATRTRAFSRRRTTCARCGACSRRDGSGRCLARRCSSTAPVPSPAIPIAHTFAVVPSDTTSWRTTHHRLPTRRARSTPPGGCCSNRPKSFGQRRGAAAEPAGPRLVRRRDRAQRGRPRRRLRSGALCAADLLWWRPMRGASGRTARTRSRATGPAATLRAAPRQHLSRPWLAPGSRRGWGRAAMRVLTSLVEAGAMLLPPLLRRPGGGHRTATRAQRVHNMLHRGICCGNSEYLLWYTRGTHLPGGPPSPSSASCACSTTRPSTSCAASAAAAATSAHVLAAYGAYDFTYRRTLAVSCGIPSETGIRRLFPDNASGSRRAARRCRWSFSVSSLFRHSLGSAAPPDQVCPARRRRVNRDQAHRTNTPCPTASPSCRACERDAAGHLWPDRATDTAQRSRHGGNGWEPAPHPRRGGSSLHSRFAAAADSFTFQYASVKDFFAGLEGLVVHPRPT